MRFTDKVACVTGAAVGIGRATALKFAQEGAKVIIMDINAESLAKAEAELKEITSDVLSYVVDVSNEALVNQSFEDAIAKFGKVDILINNAALWRQQKAFVDLTTEDWKTYFDINVMGTVYCTKAVLTGMLEREYGRIINISSVAGVYGNARMSHYSASKGAINSLTKALAKEVTDKGVLVNAVCPGSVSPAENDDVHYTRPSELAFMGRTGSDAENANLICFLASDEASYIAGQNIQIDGCRKKQ